MNKNYVAKRIEMLKLKAQIKEVNKIRKEQERKERERLREEQKLLEEAEKERKRLKAEKEAILHSLVLLVRLNEQKLNLNWQI